MSNEKKINRRTALQVIAVGAGAASSLPILENLALGQHKHPDALPGPGPAIAVPVAPVPRFFNLQELETIAAISDLIIPTDEHSPGAKAALVPAFIDLMVGESATEVQAVWREGLRAVDKMSEAQFSAAFTRASHEQQVSLLKAISRNERRPKTVEEHFFVAIKSLTVDGYYTSSIGIHQDLRYKGNAVLQQFAGCTHPEHMQ